MHSSETAIFLDSAFGVALDVPEHRLVIFTLPDKHVRAFTSIDAAAEYAVFKAKKHHVYVSTYLLNREPEGSTRGKKGDVSGIVAFCADIDVQSPVHDRENLPPDYATASAIVDRFPLKPSIVVDSGHGLQVWWLISEPWIFDSAEERAEADLLVRRFNLTTKAVAKELGDYHVDSVDLAKVLRLPGTFNRKVADDIKKVNVLHTEGHNGYVLRYHVEEVERCLVAESLGEEAVAANVQVGVFHVNPDANPPANLIAGLIDADPRFKMTWDRNRPDFVDQSLSSYDLSLARFAAQANASDQEIADLIIAFRRTNGNEADRKKSLRLDYLQRTITKARVSAARDAATARLSDEECVVSEDGSAGSSEAQRQRVIDDLSTMLGVRVKKWIMDGREDPDYYLEIDDGRKLLVGKAAAVFCASRFRDALFDASANQVVLRPFKVNQWRNVVRKLGRIVEVVENADVEPLQVVASWIESFLARGHLGRLVPESNWQSALPGCEPFLKDGCLWLHAPSLVAHVNRCDGLKVQDRDAWRNLRKGGFDNRTVSGEVDGKRTSRSYWFAPIDLLPEPLVTTIRETQYSEERK